MIFTRGTPESSKPKLYPVHYPSDRKTGALNMACYSGAYHVFYTTDKTQVTCEQCLKAINKELGE